MKKYILTLLGSGLLAFGLTQIHTHSGITEGGVLGLLLLLEYWFDISPAWTAAFLNGLCYLLGFRKLGNVFLRMSAVATAGFSLWYLLFARFSPLFPLLGAYPLAASVLGALFVGVGVGLCVRMGGAPTGDDALAMTLSGLTKLPIQWVYLGSDFAVLLLSATYLPWNRLLYSLLTVTLSGQIIGLLQHQRETHSAA